MKKTTALFVSALFVSALFSLPALAHDGHGLFGSHWHGTDALGFVGVGLLLGVAVWLSKGGK